MIDSARPSSTYYDLYSVRSCTCASSAAIASALALTPGSVMNSSAHTSLSSVRWSMAMGFGPTPRLDEMGQIADHRAVCIAAHNADLECSPALQAPGLQTTAMQQAASARKKRMDVQMVVLQFFKHL